MKEIKFGTRKYILHNLIEKEDCVYEQWYTDWLCPDNDIVELYLKKEKRFGKEIITELSFNPFSGITDSAIVIDDMQASYARTLLNITEVDELRQWLGMADEICKRFGNEEIKKL